MVIEHVLAEARTEDDADECEDYIQHQRDAFELMGKVRVQGTLGLLITVGKIDEQHDGNGEYTALEAAARGQVAMEHNIKDIYEAKRNDPVTAAAGYNALDGDVICVSFHLAPPSFFLFRPWSF